VARYIPNAAPCRRSWRIDWRNANWHGSDFRSEHIAAMNKYFLSQTVFTLIKGVTAVACKPDDFFAVRCLR
jgi:hypothetical protein